MTKKTNLFHRQALAAALCLAGACFAGQAHALLINFDLTSAAGGDPYGTGVGAFGTASSHWNEHSRGASATNLALTDDTGAATSVTVTYTRSGSGASLAANTYRFLGLSTVASGTVSFSGLVAGGLYELAIFSDWGGTPSFTVGSTTETIVPSDDWSSLTEGTQYVLLQGTADASGNLSFIPNANPTANNFPGTSPWSAFQLQDVAPPAGVPAPGTLALLSIGIAGFGFGRRNAIKA